MKKYNLLQATYASCLIGLVCWWGFYLWVS